MTVGIVSLSDFDQVGPQNWRPAISDRRKMGSLAEGLSDQDIANLPANKRAMFGLDQTP